MKKISTKHIKDGEIAFIIDESLFPKKVKIITKGANCSIVFVFHTGREQAFENHRLFPSFKKCLSVALQMNYDLLQAKEIGVLNQKRFIEKIQFILSQLNESNQ